MIYCNSQACCVYEDKITNRLNEKFFFVLFCSQFLFDRMIMQGECNLSPTCQVRNFGTAVQQIFAADWIQLRPGADTLN
jgi:hypothetical protein